MTDNIVFKLEKPFQFGSEEVSEIKLHEPTAKDLMSVKLKDADFKEMFEFACSCADEPVKKLEKMAASDAIKFVQVVSDFLESGRETGKI